MHPRYLTGVALFCSVPHANAGHGYYKGHHGELGKALFTSKGVRTFSPARNAASTTWAGAADQIGSNAQLGGAALEIWKPLHMSTNAPLRPARSLVDAVPKC